MPNYVLNLKMCADFLFSLVYFLICVAFTQQINVIETRNSSKLKIDKDDGKGSLVFVFDTTGSMFNDLRQLREGAEMILKTALEDSNVIADFVFVPFHDPSVGPPTVTRNKQVFKSALNIVHVYGGGDCPEKSLTGIQLALNVSRPQSFIYVFTDATASDHRLVGKVLDSIQRKQSQVVFVLTGHCNDLDKPHYKVYQQIAAASSGQVFNLNKTSVHKVLEFVRTSIKGRTVNLASAVNPAGYNYTQEIPVDKRVNEVTVSVSGAKPRIKVVNPGGEELTGPPQLVTTLDLSEIMIVKVLQPEPGNWSITVGSEEEHSVKVVGMSNLTFKHGFSVQPPRSMDETSYRPLQGTYNHMLIALSESNASLQMDHVQLLSLNGTPLYEIPMKEMDNETNTYVVNAFIPPDDFFNIAIIGRDEYGQEVRRIGPTAVQAKPPDAPYLIVPKRIEVRSHERVSLTCHVESLVPVSATWTRQYVKLAPATTSLQSTSIEHVIQDMSEGDVGMYRCVAKNSAGITRAGTLVDLIVDPPRVTISPANMTVTEGEQIVISCSVFSEALLKRSTINFYGTKQNYSIDVHLEPTRDGYYTFNKTIQLLNESDSGVYTCEAANRAGKSIHSTYINVQSKPTAQIIGPHSLTISIHTDTQFVCQIENALSVQWLNKNKQIIEKYNVNGSFTSALDIKNVSEDGVWTCMAIQSDYNASDSIQVTVLIKPQVHIEGAHNVTVLSDIQYQIFCTIVAKPEPRIIWHMETERFLPCDTLNPEPNVYKSMLTLDSEKYPLNGTYFCIGENSEGIGEDSITINVRDKMKLLEGFTDTSVELYSQISFHCNITSFPIPTIKWFHNNTIISNDNENNTNINISEDKSRLNIEKVDFRDLGEYKCIADNVFENITVKGNLTVRGLSKPIILKRMPKIISKTGESANITCRILKSSPKPTITWQFKPNLSNNYTTLPKTVIIDNDIITIEYIRKEHTGTYRCIADNVMGQDEYNVELIVQYPPELKESSHPSRIEGPIQVKAGGSVKLNCNVTGFPPPIVTWTKDDLPIAFANNVYIANDSSLVIENATKFDSGVFTCNASSIVGFVTKNFSIAVFSPPIITVYGEREIEVLEGQLVHLPCSAAGEPQPRLAWARGGRALPMHRKFIDEYGLRFVANLTDFGEYTCLASNEYGNASKNYTVYVWVPPRLVPPLEDLKEVLIGANVHLQCDAIGFPIPTIIWEFKDEILINNTMDVSYDKFGNLYITNSSSIHEGLFVCIAQNVAGEAKKSFYITVNEAAKIQNDNYTGPYIASNLDVALTISCRATGKPEPYVTWIKDGFYLDNDPRYIIEKDGTLTINFPSEDLSGVYMCEARNAFATDRRNVPVEIYSLPTLQEEGTATTTTVVEGSSVEVQCPVRNGYTVKWYKDAALISNGSLTISNISRHNESQYACVASNALGSIHTNIFLKVVWPPKFLENVYGSANMEAVKGEDVYFDCKTDGKPRGEVRWYFNSKFLFGEDKEILKLMNVQLKHNGVYKCVVKNEYGTAFKEINLDVLERPFIYDFDVLDVELKSGANATLECNARGTPKPNSTWIFNNTNWIIQNTTITTINVTQQSEGLFQCMASNKAGKSYITYRVIVVAGAKIQEILLFVNGTGYDVDNSTDLILNASVRIACKATGNPAPNIQWIRYGNIISENDKGIGYVDLVLPDVKAYDSGDYICVTSNEGGIDDRTMKVNVLEPPRIFQTLLQNDNTSENLVNIEVISGQAFYLHCHPYGNPLPEIYWFKDGLPLKLYDDSMVSSDFGEIVHSKSAMYEQIGNYTCVARNKVGEESVVYLVDVLVPPPSLKDNTKQVTVLQHSPLIMSCGIHPLHSVPLEDHLNPLLPNNVLNSHTQMNPVLSAHPSPAMLWLRHPYTEIAESPRVKLQDDNYTLIITNTEVADSGKYSCIMTNKVGTTELIYEVIIQKPPEIKNNKENETIEEHIVIFRRSIVLKCEVDGNPPPKITWFKDIQKLKDDHPNIQNVQSTSVVALWDARAAHAAQYICVAENNAGTALRRYNVRVKVPGKWSSWSSWSYCNVTCGLGYQRRERRCQYVDDDNNIFDAMSRPVKIILDETECKGTTNDRRKCRMPPCEEETSRWSPWSTWSSCSASCGDATQARSRTCRGDTCQGDNIQIRKCSGMPPCRFQRTQTNGDINNNGDVDEVEENIMTHTNLDYLPEATFEMNPEANIPEQPDDDYSDFYIPQETIEGVYYDVNVTSNLDGSEQGPCEPGYTYKNDSCHDIDECTMDTNACHATQLCANVRGAYRCACARGYAALGAGARCLDINECQQGTHGCSYACVNVAGGHVCACPAHLRLHSDRRHCVTPSSYKKPISYEDIGDEDYPERKQRH